MKPNLKDKKQWNHSRGVALITTLLLLSLFTVMTLAMVIATTSDTLIDGYYRNFRGSFYASDSGINAARQYLINQFDASTITASNYTSIGSTIVGNLTNTSSGFGTYQTIIGSQTSSWPGQFEVDSTNTYLADATHPPTCQAAYTAVAGLPANESCTQVAAQVTASPSLSQYLTNYQYNFPYKITVIGQSRTNEQNKIEEQGSIVVNVAITSNASTNTSFAAWGTLLDQYAICGSPFVKGTMTGPFFSNQSWNFGDNGLVGSGSYIFTGTVGSAAANVGYMYSDGTCHQSAAASDSETVTTTTGSGRNQKTTTTTTTIAPTFQAGLQVGQNAVPLPTNTFSQEQAVIDGIGACGSPCNGPSQAQMNSSLRDVTTNSNWPATGSPSSGVYVPYSTVAVGGCTTPPCFTGGGILVQGNADQVTMTASTSGSGSTAHKLQVFVIKQGSTTTTVTLDLTANSGVGTTTITDNLGHSSGTITGVPMNNSSDTEAAMLYVNGAISGTSGSTTTGLTGPSSGAAIQDGSAVTVTSTGDIAITGNITYSHEPVTLTQSGSTPADTLITSPSVPTNVLGIYTSGGDIQMRPTANVSNMEVDASLAMIHSGGSGGMVAQWNTIGTLTIVGGRIANEAKSGASLSTRNIWFDQRFAQGGFAPPWFPSTTVTTTGTGTAQPPIASAMRTSWVNCSVIDNSTNQSSCQ